MLHSCSQNEHTGFESEKKSGRMQGEKQSNQMIGEKQSVQAHVHDCYAISLVR
jgi:hypothetical protein